MRKLLTFLTALTLVLGACGSDDDTSTASDGADAVDDGSGDAGAGNDNDAEGEGEGDETDADDQARLDAALDQIEDVAIELGYTTERSPADDTDDEDDLQFESEQCQEADEVFNRLDEEFPETAASESLDATRGEFTAPDSETEQLNVELSSFSSSDEVDQAFETLASVPLADCMREAFESESDDEVAVAVASVDVTEGGRGDRELVISIQATFSGGGVDIPVDLAFSFVGVGRDAVFFGIFAFNSSPSADASTVLDTAIAALQ